jgi:hypothetical protein
MEAGQNKKVSEAAKMLSKLGASKGGKARAEALTPEERQMIAREAVTTRWLREKENPVKTGHTTQAKILKATHGSADRPLRIGDIEIPCYVLEDGRRVIVETGMRAALALGRGGLPRVDGVQGYRLTSFVAGKRIKPFIPERLYNTITRPIPFRTPAGVRAYGYEATVLVDLCTAVLAARDAGVLQKQQQHIAERCEILVRGFARVGVIALVDEATGYQEERDREELHKILAAYISEELLPWAKRFPDEFFREMFRLRGWQYHPMTKQGPRKAGELTSQIVYEKLPPSVLEELRSRNPVIRKGKRKYKHHQFLTEEIGHEHLKNHLIGVTTLMRASTTWREFELALERAFPSYQKPAQIEMMLDMKGHYEMADHQGAEIKQA